MISPGPGYPDDAGISMDVIRTLGPGRPVLGVCLGHQCIGEVFGGQVIRAPALMHGKTSAIHHDGTGLFSGLPAPFDATRYHSLIVAEPLPAGAGGDRLHRYGRGDGPAPPRYTRSSACSSTPSRS